MQHLEYCTYMAIVVGTRSVVILFRIYTYIDENSTVRLGNRCIQCIYNINIQHIIVYCEHMKITIILKIKKLFQKGLYLITK